MKDYIKFLKKTTLFLILLVVLDFIFGFVMDRIAPQIDNGEYGRDNYISNKAHEDLLIFGSSRAESHYNSKMIEDSLGMTCYNCGQRGHLVFLNYARLCMILERHHPKIIIYDIMPGFDLLADDDNYKDMSFLKLHYNRKDIPSIINDIGTNEKYKLLSSMYRYNSTFLQLLLVRLRGSDKTDMKGFKPKEAQNDVWLTPPPMKTEWSYDSLKLAYLDKFIEKAGDAELIFFVSPFWRGMNTDVLAPVKEKCRQHGIKLIDYSNNPKYLKKTELYNDYAHLNAKGADLYTQDVIKELKAK